jgi:poly-gamma-glutamate capsule biosynthesis protein CapA/YwtB (metallophosphatase superfamily)
MKVVEAKIITPCVPPDLQALRILERPAASPTVRVCAVGDIGLSGRVSVTAGRYGADTLFADVAPVLRAADITFGNLESPLAGDIAPGKMFAAPATGAVTLRNAGFDLLHLANNHVVDYGQLGMAATLNGLRKAGLVPLGAGDNMAAARHVVRTDANGFRIGWLGCGRTLVHQSDSGPYYWEFDEKELLAAISKARPTVDLLIVSIHTGLSFLDYPHPDHKEMAGELMRRGADMVLMHHPHVLQGIEVNESGHVCCFSLGNFLWDNLEGNIHTNVMLEERHESAVFICDMDAKGVFSVAALPTWIDTECRVRWAVGPRGDKILRRLEEISRALSTNYRATFHCQRVQRNYGHILRYIAFHICRGHWRIVIEQLLRVRFEHLTHMVQYVLSRVTGKARALIWKDS